MLLYAKRKLLSFISCKEYSSFRYIPIRYLVNKGSFNYVVFILFPLHYNRDQSFELYKGSLRCCNLAEIYQLLMSVNIINN